jgi:hypothetical protein
MPKGLNEKVINIIAEGLKTCLCFLGLLGYYIISMKYIEIENVLYYCFTLYAIKVFDSAVNSTFFVKKCIREHGFYL